MTRKIGDDAFEYYVSLGPKRSHKQLAERYDVTRRAVVKAAAREKWAERLARIEEGVRERTDQRLGETLEEIRLRHLKLLRAMSSRVARALQEYPLRSGMEAIRAAETVIRLERLVAGEAADRTEMTVEQVTREEIGKLLVNVDSGAECDDEGDDW